MKLEGKTALVTGAGRGIGRAAALCLAREGASVVVNYQNNAAAAEETARDIEAAGAQALIVQASVDNAADVERMVQTVKERFGQIDILVNNAGITRDQLLLRMKEEDWDAVLNTNLKGAFLCCKAVAPLMVKRRTGVIVNVGSVIGTVGAAGQVNYSAAKAGLVGLTKSLAKELGSRSIRVNAVAPGFIETDMTRALKPEQQETVRKQIPLGRLGKPEDVGRVIAFLCSEDAAYIQGILITVDGGLFL